MANRIYRYLAEGECEEKLLNTLKMKPALIHPGKVERFNVIQNELTTRKLMQFPSGCVVVLVFDTDKDVTEHLKKNIELLQGLSFNVEVLTVLQVLNFEDEIERSTDVKHAHDFTKSETTADFKSAVNRMKERDFRSALRRHNLDMTKLWTQKPPNFFRFVQQDSAIIKCTES